MEYLKVDLPSKNKLKLLALGAQSKAGFCFLKDGAAYLSMPDGDLLDLKNLKLFQTKIKIFERRLKVKPRIIACDLHPEYISTKLANDMAEDAKIKIRKIQHHKAHIASCIVDNNVRGKIIGIAFDGTGFGEDLNIWGGEFFVGTVRGFKRVAHLEYIPMPGGEASIREPWRMGLSCLYNVYGAGFKRLKFDFLTRLDKGNLEVLIQMIDKNINSPLTSSIGRLFDAVSSIIGVCDKAGYEGQAAVELERMLDARYSILDVRCFPRLRPSTGSGLRSGQAMLDARNRYSFKYEDKEGVIIIDWTSVIRGIVKDIQAKKDKAEVSLKFHNAVCHMIKDVCNLLRKKYKIDKVCMSGGVFQNRYLVSHIRPILEKDGFEVYSHNKIPTHDGGISLGQAVLACV